MSDTHPVSLKTSPAARAAARTTPVLLCILLLGALVFYKERMLFIDAPHVLFHVVNNGSFLISEQRYGSFISQSFPLLAGYMELPLRWIMVLYSAGFYLFYTSVIALLVYKFKNYGLAILGGLYYTLFVSATFYWPNNEIHQGIAWLLLAFALHSFATDKKWPALPALLLFTCSFFLAIWTHPLVMPVAIYLWIFYLADKRTEGYTRVQLGVATVILLLLAYLKFSHGMHHGYDSGKIELVTGFSLSKIITIFTSPQFRFFIHGCLTNYWLFVVLFIAGLAGLLYQKKYLLACCTFFFFFGCLALICITYWDSTSRFYLESEYMPLTIIGCAPFVYYVLPHLKAKTAMAVMICIFAIRLVYIGHAAQPFSNRVALLEQMNDKMKQKNLTKLILSAPTKNMNETLIMNWGAPVESIIISKLRGEEPQRTFMFMDSSQLKTFDIAAKDTMLGCWEKWPQARLNSRYFHIDTCTAYKIMSADELMR